MKHDGIGRVCHGVQVRRLRLIDTPRGTKRAGIVDYTVVPDVTITLVVGENHDDIGPLGHACCGGEMAQEEGKVKEEMKRARAGARLEYISAEHGFQAQWESL